MPQPYSIGTDEDSNGFKVTTDDGTLVGWVYPMDYIDGREGTWGAISGADGLVSDASLYEEGFGDRRSAAEWLVRRWSFQS